MGFSLRGPAGLRLHFNSYGKLGSISLKSFAGMRAIYGSNGSFKGLSLPGLFRSRVFVNSRGEFNGFGLPRLFGGFLIFNNKCELVRSYGPAIGGMCVSHDASGNRKKHIIKGVKKNTFIDSEVRTELPETNKVFGKKGEVTDKGIIPISEKDAGLFNIKESRKPWGNAKTIKNSADHKNNGQIFHENEASGNRIRNDINEKTVHDKDTAKQTVHIDKAVDINENGSFVTEKDYGHLVDDAVGSSLGSDVSEIKERSKEEIKIGPCLNTEEELNDRMTTLDKAVEEAFPDQELISFDDYCMVKNNLKDKDS